MDAHSDRDRDRQSTLDVGIPLHYLTDSADDVASVVGELLDNISRFDAKVSHNDILQALAITTALRLAMAETETGSDAAPRLRLLDIEVDSDERRSDHGKRKSSSSEAGHDVKYTSSGTAVTDFLRH